MFFDPANSTLAPKCMFKTLTGYDCPSCGGQRVLHELLSGNIIEAFWINPFLFIAIPYLLAIAYTAFAKGAVAKRLKPTVQHTVTISFYLILYIGWWILRNTPLWQGL